MTLQEMQAHVQNEAMERYMTELEKETKATMAGNVQMKDSMQGGVDDEKNERVKMRQLAQKNQMDLKEQIEQNKAKRSNQRHDFIEAASSHEFPLFTETFISQDAVDKARKAQKERFRTDLNEQLTQNNMLRNIEIKKDSEHARWKCTQGVIAMQQQRGAEQDRLAQMGKELVASWDRDVKLRALKKSMSATRVREL
jgi:hypothetical protein